MFSWLLILPLNYAASTFISKQTLHIYKHNHKNNAYIIISLYSSFSSIYIIPYLVFTTLYPCILYVPLCIPYISMYLLYNLCIPYISMYLLYTPLYPLYIYVSSIYTSVSPIYPLSIYTLYLLYPVVAVPLYAPISP